MVLLNIKLIIYVVRHVMENKFGTYLLKKKNNNTVGKNKKVIGYKIIIYVWLFTILYSKSYSQNVILSCLIMCYLTYSLRIMNVYLL